VKQEFYMYRLHQFVQRAAEQKRVTVPPEILEEAKENELARTGG